jgi:hypothetical protein
VTNTLLFQTLLVLTPLERKHLGQWLRSPFFNSRTQLVDLFDYLHTCIEQRVPPDADQALRFAQQTPRAYVRTKPVKHPKQAPATPDDEQRLRLIVSELLRHVEQFLVYEEQESDVANFRIALANAYRKRGLEKQFQQSLQAARSAWERQPHRHAEYFEAQVAIEYEQYQYLSGGRRTEQLNLQPLSDQTDSAYIARKLRQVCFALTHQNVFKADYDFGLLPAVLAHVAQSPALLHTPAIGLYFYCYQFLVDPTDEGAFRAFKHLLFESTTQLPEAEQRNLHLLAINFCIKKLNLLEAAYFREALDLYQSALRGGFLLENGVLSHFAFNNIVAIALKVGDDAWVEQFIPEYADFLEKKHRNASFHLNLARLDYKRGHFRAALLHLQEADYKDLINNLIAKTLQLKIYYQTGEMDALDAHLVSMQTFIRRQRGIGYHKTNYLNIVRYARKLARHNPNSRSERAALRQQIMAETSLTEKDWFLEQLG